MALQRPLPNLSVTTPMRSESGPQPSDERLLQGMSAVVKDVGHLRSLMNSRIEEGQASVTHAKQHINGIETKMKRLAAEGKRLQHDLELSKPTFPTTQEQWNAYLQRRQAVLEKCTAIHGTLESLRAEKVNLKARVAEVEAAIGKKMSRS